jgi:hypothetical protein
MGTSRTVFVRRGIVESTSSTKRDLDRQNGLGPSTIRPVDLTALLEENKQLRELVIQLSKIVIRSAADQK